MKDRSKEFAQVLVSNAIAGGKLRDLAEPVVESMIAQCRNSIGLACFGTSPDNDTLWERYGGSGCGVCIECDVPDELLGSELHIVQYCERKLLHVDTFLRSTSDQAAAAQVYEVSLLSKPLKWNLEAEVRFVSKRQNVNVAIQGAHITRRIVGEAVPLAVRATVTELAQSIPITDRTCTATA